MRKLLPLSGLMAIVGYANAQQLLVPLAQNYATTGSSTATWRTTLFHFQMQYDDTLFTGAGVSAPITITRIRFRALDGVPNAGGQVYSGVTIKMAQNTLDFSAMSTTFATNLATPAGGTTVFSGAVTCLPSAGTVPNNYGIDITLSPAFVYDPTLGDLVIDVDSPAAPVTANLPSFSCSNLPAHKGRRMSTATAAALTGALSDFASVCLLDFTGPGGYTDHTGAQVHAFGAPCNTPASTFYEAFNFGDPFDLASGGLTLTPSGAANYAVTPVAGAIQPPSGTATLLSVADDATVTSTLPFTLSFPGGTTTTISSCTNGFIHLGTSTNTDLSPTSLELRNSLARLAPFWHDLHAGRNTTTHPGAGLYFEYDATTNPLDPVALVTWKDVGVFRAGSVVPNGGQCVANFQVAIHQLTGVIEYRYGSLGTAVGQGLAIVGFSNGGTVALPAADPGSRNLSAEVPFATTGPDVATTLPLTLTATARPALGAAVTLTTTNIPLTAVTTYTMLSIGATSPGTPIGGAPGCLLSIAVGGVFVSMPVGPPPTGTLPLTIPPVVSLVAMTFAAQSATLAPGVNALGVLSSNGLLLTIGHL